MTEDGKKLLIELEGLRPGVYRDSKGLLTIGVGHLLTQSELSSGKIRIGDQCFDYRNGLTKEQCLALMEADVAVRVPVVEKLVTAKLTSNQLDALMMCAFNIGLDAFEHSTLLKKVNAGEFDEVPAQMRRWIYSGGQKIEGLSNRREAEIRLWNSHLN